MVAGHHILLSWDLTGGEDGTGATGELIPPGEKAPKDKPGLITAKATGPDGPPCYPGPFGQYSGPRGDGPGVISLDGDGAPIEDCGKHGYRTGGKIESTCRAWLYVDGKQITGGGLHNDAYKGKYLDLNTAIVPPNAFQVAEAEIRNNMTTSLTKWERNYRTMLGGFVGPQAKIMETDEPRRLDYDYPSYEFKPGGLAGGKFFIPTGDKLLSRNPNVAMAELQIWTGKSLDAGDYLDLFIGKGGKPALRVKKIDDTIGAPSTRLHWATSWIKGGNTGTEAQRQTGTASGTDQKTVKKNKGGFDIIGDVERYKPNPVISGGGGGGSGPPVVLPSGGDPIGSGGPPGAGPGLPALS